MHHLDSKNKNLEDTASNSTADVEVDFGFSRVSEQEKTAKVGAVFTSVAKPYDLMNDAMSLGLHRVWKNFAMTVARLRPHERLLDVASGSGDLVRIALKKCPSIKAVACDINSAMLHEGIQKLTNQGLLVDAIQAIMA